MSALVIVESPAKAKTIARFLGKGYRVEASYGHVRDLPEKSDEIPDSIRKERWARFGVNLDGNFEPVYVIPESKKKHVEKLRKALAECDRLLLATDEDREGESISWHLIQILHPTVPVQRIVFHEITPEAIHAALANPREVDVKLVEAQESRRILDRLYGYSLSPVLWKKVQSGLSAGRVQSVAVRLIAEREEERRAFVSSVYWDVQAAFGSASGEFRADLVRLGGVRLASGRDFDSTTGRLTGGTVRVLDDAAARKLAEECRRNMPWRVGAVEQKPGSQRPAPPFTTSTLQQEANRKLGFTAERTMRTAQRLYEGVDLGGQERAGLITYMRTDSVTLSERALEEAQREIHSIYGPEFARGARRYKTKTRNAQEAHEAIRPTMLERRPASVASFLTPDELKIYDLIWKRTIASQMPDAELLRTTVEIVAKDKSGTEAVFAATGKQILFPGYLRAYVEGSDDPAADLGDQETVLPPLRAGQEIRDARVPGAHLLGVEPKRHETVPPPRYTEASLVKKLEDAGVGRPSTYATIITTIQNRGYVFKHPKSNALVPTFTAMAVTHLLRNHFGHYVDVNFTARMEEELDEIADGKRERVEHVRHFYRGNGDGGKTPGLETLIAREQDQINFPALPLGKDSGSGEAIEVRIGRFGPFVQRGTGGEGNAATIPPKTAPADFTVEQALSLIARRAEGPRQVGVDPKTGLTVYAATGRFGPYVQLGETPKEKDSKPRRASLPRGMAEDAVTIEKALELLSLPRELGAHPANAEPVLANIGRYGPYVQNGKEFRSIPNGEDPHTIAFERALELLSQPKNARGGGKQTLNDLGKSSDGREIKVLSGRYGPYVTDGTLNATLPKGMEPTEMGLGEALDLLAAKAANPPKGKPARKGARKSSSRKKTAT
ncbi:type I DNA topoisomerase [Candidatus Poribacteria bacterium]|nr:type I DNA topoisomerase [Candidatus Poribacteria bacterium]